MSRKARRGEAREWLDALLADPPATDDCVEWPFSVNGAGYGSIKLGGTHVTVTRIVLGQLAGPPADRRLHAAHAPLVCHNRLCVNPKHLRWATNLENVADRDLDGTTPKGERHGMAKLTADRALSIYHTEGKPSDVARQFGVPRETVRHIKKGYSWSSVTGHAPKTARLVHAQRGAVPSGAVPPQRRGTVAHPSPSCPPAGLRGGPDRHQAPSSAIVGPGGPFAPAGFHRPTAARPGHHGGAAC